MSIELRSIAAAVAVSLASGTAGADLIVQEIVDGTISSQPKWVELVNTGTECVFLGDYELCNYNNGNTTPSGCSDLGDVFLAPGASYVFAYESAGNTACAPNMTCFEYVYGFAADQHGGASINGDDALALRLAATQALVDVYGIIGEDGTGTIWEYTDGYSTRITSTASPVFLPQEWFLAGPDALEDPGGDPAELILLQTLTSPGTYAPCVPPVVSYCTAGTSASGCVATLSASGSPSASAPSGFTLSATSVEGGKPGVFFLGTAGRAAKAWGTGTSFQCVAPPISRTGVLAPVGLPGTCDGAFDLDLNSVWCPGCPQAAKNPGPGTVVQAQLWYRDPLSPSGTTTSLSDAIELTVSP